MGFTAKPVIYCSLIYLTPTPAILETATFFGFNTEALFRINIYIRNASRL